MSKQVQQLTTDPSALWQHYQETGDVEARNDLLMHYIGLVKRVANRLIVSSGSYHELDDLISCGVIGLMEAIERFDPARGGAFEAYAQIRIKGEMIDYMRRQDWVPVHTRQRFRQIEAAFQQIAQETGCPASELAVANRLGMTLTDLQHLLGEAQLMNVLNFEEMLQDGGSPDLFASGETLFDRELEDRDLMEDLARQISQLTAKEQMVLSLYYQDELTLKEIGIVLELTESRISQIHSAAILKLRTRFKQRLQIPV